MPPPPPYSCTNHATAGLISVAIQTEISHISRGDGGGPQSPPLDTDGVAPNQSREAYAGIVGADAGQQRQQQQQQRDRSRRLSEGRGVSDVQFPSAAAAPVASAAGAQRVSGRRRAASTTGARSGATSSSNAHPRRGTSLSRQSVPHPQQQQQQEKHQHAHEADVDSGVVDVDDEDGGSGRPRGWSPFFARHGRARELKEWREAPHWATGAGWKPGRTIPCAPPLRTNGSFGSGGGGGVSAEAPLRSSGSAPASAEVENNAHHADTPNAVAVVEAEGISASSYSASSSSRVRQQPAPSSNFASSSYDSTYTSSNYAPASPPANEQPVAAAVPAADADSGTAYVDVINASCADDDANDVYDFASASSSSHRDGGKMTQASTQSSPPAGADANMGNGATTATSAARVRVTKHGNTGNAAAAAATVSPAAAVGGGSSKAATATSRFGAAAAAASQRKTASTSATTTGFTWSAPRRYRGDSGGASTSVSRTPLPAAAAHPTAAAATAAAAWDRVSAALWGVEASARGVVHSVHMEKQLQRTAAAASSVAATPSIYSPAAGGDVRPAAAAPAAHFDRSTAHLQQQQREDYQQQHRQQQRQPSPSLLSAVRRRRRSVSASPAKESITAAAADRAAAAAASWPPPQQQHRKVVAFHSPHSSPAARQQQHTASVRDTADVESSTHTGSATTAPRVASAAPPFAVPYVAHLSLREAIRARRAAAAAAAMTLRDVEAASASAEALFAALREEREAVDHADAEAARSPSFSVGHSAVSPWPSHARPASSSVSAANTSLDLSSYLGPHDATGSSVDSSFAEFATAADAVAASASRTDREPIIDEDVDRTQQHWDSGQVSATGDASDFLSLTALARTGVLIPTPLDPQNNGLRHRSQQQGLQQQQDEWTSEGSLDALNLSADNNRSAAASAAAMTAATSSFSSDLERVIAAAQTGSADVSWLRDDFMVHHQQQRHPLLQLPWLLQQQQEEGGAELSQDRSGGVNSASFAPSSLPLISAEAAVARPAMVLPLQPPNLAQYVLESPGLMVSAGGSPAASRLLPTRAIPITATSGNASPRTRLTFDSSGVARGGDGKRDNNSSMSSSSSTRRGSSPARPPQLGASSTATQFGASFAPSEAVNAPVVVEATASATVSRELSLSVLATDISGSVMTYGLDTATAATTSAAGALLQSRRGPLPPPLLNPAPALPSLSHIAAPPPLSYLHIAALSAISNSSAPHASQIGPHSSLNDARPTLRTSAPHESPQSQQSPLLLHKSAHSVTGPSSPPVSPAAVRAAMRAAADSSSRSSSMRPQSSAATVAAAAARSTSESVSSAPGDVPAEASAVVAATAVASTSYYSGAAAADGSNGLDAAHPNTPTTAQSHAAVADAAAAGAAAAVDDSPSLSPSDSRAVRPTSDSVLDVVVQLQAPPDSVNELSLPETNEDDDEGGRIAAFYRKWAEAQAAADEVAGGEDQSGAEFQT